MENTEEKKLTADEITRAVVVYSSINRQSYLICPNVSHGWGLSYEADLIAISRNHYAVEIEIKTTKSDLRADLKKQKWVLGLDRRIDRFFYAVPEELIGDAEKVAKLEHGIIKVKKVNWGLGFVASIHRRAKKMGAKPIETNDFMKMGNLLQHRFWAYFIYKGKT